MWLELQLGELHKLGHQSIQTRPLLMRFWFSLPLITSCKIWVVLSAGVIYVAMLIHFWPYHATHKINLLVLPWGCPNNGTVICGVSTTISLIYHDSCPSCTIIPSIFLLKDSPWAAKDAITSTLNIHCHAIKKLPSIFQCLVSYCPSCCSINHLADTLK